MLIYLCLSSHGYGHAARQAAILSEIHRIKPHWRLIVSSAVNIQFLKIAFKGIPVEYRRIRWDIGVEQFNAFKLDTDRTLSEMINLDKELPLIIKQEAKWIQSQKCPSIILADIPPSAVDLAEALNVSLIWMGNFGWDEIYESLGEKFVEHVIQARERYFRGNLLLRFPFSLPMNWGVNENSIGLVASNPKKLDEDFTTKVLSDSRPIVLVGFGGLGFDLDCRLFDKWSDFLFLVPNNFINRDFYAKRTPNNIINLPECVRVVDVLPYCTRYICKPGFSTFCEALVYNVGLHVVKRSDFIEAEALMKGLALFGKYRILQLENLVSGEWELDHELIQPRQSLPSTNGSTLAANRIINFIEV